MPKHLESRWPEIKRWSMSDDELHRTASLATAVGCLEQALTAVGIEAKRHGGRSEGLQKRLSRSAFSSTYKKAPDAGRLRAAIEARNSAVHQHVVPDPVACQNHVLTLHKAWCASRRTFVTKESAAALAKAILASEAVSTVFLYGSLAHGSRDPKDIDLLLFDDGEYSSWQSHYFGAEWILQQEFLATPANQAAIRCGWLDYIVVDGTRFGSDRLYTLNLAQRNDPLFYINAAVHLQQFEPKSMKWTQERPQIFERLAGIRKQLEIENIVSSEDAPRHPRAHRQGARRLTKR